METPSVKFDLCCTTDELHHINQKNIKSLIALLLSPYGALLEGRQVNQLQVIQSMHHNSAKHCDFYDSTIKQKKQFPHICPVKRTVNHVLL